ncbi:hypothetical protein WAI453_004502 [Rhynchosporium graminicola]
MANAEKQLTVSGCCFPAARVLAKSMIIVILTRKVLAKLELASPLTLALSVDSGGGDDGCTCCSTRSIQLEKNHYGLLTGILSYSHFLR